MEQVCWRLYLGRGFGERRKPFFPGADRDVEIRLAQTVGGERRALAGVERA
ncbi:MAG TPA: hypothetical protein VMS87_09725 [Roseiarcus sp.]|nr:hypothetical protein [Roseiarcus sp.]